MMTFDDDTYDDPQFPDSLYGYEEHLAFELGAEDMERRARRREAEREADAEAYWAQLEAEEQSRCRSDTRTCSAKFMRI